VTESPAVSARARFRGGMRIGMGLALPSSMLAITFGALVRQQGWGIIAPIVCSLVVFSGSAQFALATALAGGSGIAPAVAAAGLINARFLPMGVAIARSLPGGRLRGAIEGQAVVDASWVAAHLGDGRFDRERLIGATIVQWPFWVAGTALGVFVAPSTHVLHTFGVDVVFPAFFLVLLLDELRTSARARLAAGIGAATAAALLWVAPPGVALIGAIVGALVGLVGRHGSPETGGDADIDPEPTELAMS
jgi:4-azaleucine resistance transporter AzlC